MNRRMAGLGSLTIMGTIFLLVHMMNLRSLHATSHTVTMPIAMLLNSLPKRGYPALPDITTVSGRKEEKLTFPMRL